MKTILGILFALILVLSMGGIAPPVAAASSALEPAVESSVINVPEDYPTIQEAVDAAQAGDTIMVAAGEYDAFVMMGKSDITIAGAEGATVTSAVWGYLGIGPIEAIWGMAIVAYSENIAIEGIDFDGSAVTGQDAVLGVAYVDSTGSIADLTVQDISGIEMGVGVAIVGETDTFAVDISSVTVESAMVGIALWNAEADLDSCTITQMSPAGGYGVMGMGTGVMIGVPGEWEFPVHGSSVRLTGSTIADNDVGISVWTEATVEAHFNQILASDEWGFLNETPVVLNAVNNWWGHASGPYHPTENPDGTGNAVSDNVDFRPWLAVGDIGPVKTETVENDTLDAREEADATVGVTGKATVTVARYRSNPGGDPPAGWGALGKYIDVYVPDTSQVTEIEIRIYYTDDEVPADVDKASLRLLWLDGSDWKPCSDSGVNTSATNGYSGYIWAKIRADTEPPLARLNEMECDGGYTGPTPPPTGACFIATAAYGTDTATELDIMREFRDTVLLTNSLGAGFVHFYYRTSPPVADLISRHDVLRTAVRTGFVDPVVRALNWSHGLWS